MLLKVLDLSRHLVLVNCTISMYVICVYVMYYLYKQLERIVNVLCNKSPLKLLFLSKLPR